MLATSSNAPRLRSSSRRGRSALIGLATLLSLAAVPSVALAGPGNVVVKSVYAGPIQATTSADPATNENLLCTPEPDEQDIYGTKGAFDQSIAPLRTAKPQSGLPGDADYEPANMPSTADLNQHRALQAGASNDLCFGFTLTPNMQTTPDPNFILSASNSVGRLPESDGLGLFPDVDATHVAVVGGNAVNNDDIQDVTIDMPAGFSGEPDSGAQCPASAFGEGNYFPVTCANDTQIGTAFIRVSTIVSGVLRAHIAVGGAANASGGLNGGQVFNLAHGPNELGRLGVSVVPVSGVAPAKFTVSLQLTADGRVRTVVQNAPKNLYLADTTPGNNIDPVTGQPTVTNKPAPLYVESIGVRAWGAAADHAIASGGNLDGKNFAQWGTDCTTPLNAHVAVDTVLGTHSEMSSPSFNLTGCDQLPFNPSITVTTSQNKPGVPTGATVTVGLDQTLVGGHRSALLKNAAVTLPAGLEIGAQIGSKEGGLKLCTEAQFGPTTTAANGCASESLAGDVQITTPLISRPFLGHVYLGPQSAVGELPSLYIEASPQGSSGPTAPRIKLVGTATVGSDGSITTTFNNNPQLRFSELKLTFPDGPNALFTTPRACGTTTGTSQFVSSAKPDVVTRTSSLTINQDCATVPFTPGFSFAPSDSAVGSRAPTTVTITRPDRSAWLKDVKVDLPPGFLADLKQVTECDAAAAATGNCPDTSRMGSVHTLAGVGPDPLALDGQMYMSGRVDGAVAGAVIVVQAKIGEIDLGTVVVPARIDLRPTDAGLTLSTTAPLRFRNLALNLREITVRLDRDNFPLNPTACGPLAATATLGGDDASSSTATSNVTYTGCAAKGFAPGITATLTGDNKPGGHPTVDVTVTPRPGDSNLKSTTVILPDGVSTDSDNIRNSCPVASFNASSCPATTRVGSATATVSITNDVIPGDIYLVEVPGQVLPGLGMSFTGRYAQRVLSTVKVGVGSRLTTSFGTIPDLPLTRLSLKIDGGSKDPIRMSQVACTADSSWDAAFGGQGGQTSSSKIAYPCATKSTPTAKAKWSRTKGLTLSWGSFGGKKLKSAKVTLPNGFRFASGKSGRKALKRALKVGAHGAKVNSKNSSKSLTVTSKTPGATSLKIALKTKGYKRPNKYRSFTKFKKGLKLKFKTTLSFVDGTKTVKTYTIKVAR